MQKRPPMKRFALPVLVSCILSVAGALALAGPLVSAQDHVDPTQPAVPDGGAVLCGGLREMLQKGRRAEIPLLGQIPIISLLFRREGIADENGSLADLVRATITDVKDLMAGR